MGDRGYSIHAVVFSREEMRSAAAAIENSSLPRSRAGTRHMLGCAAVARLASDARMIGLASQWLGTGAIPFKATLFDKSAAANWLVAWHQDKIAVHTPRRVLHFEYAASLEPEPGMCLRTA